MRARLTLWGLSIVSLVGSAALLSGCRDSRADTLSSSPTPARSVEAPQPPASAAASAAGAPEKPPAERIVISAIGDCTLGADTDSRNAPSSFPGVMREKGDDYAYPFSGTHQILEQDDLTIANLETTLTLGKPPEKTGTFQFAGDPAYAKVLKAGSVELVNVANNHSHDMGERGYQDTLASVEAEGIGAFGNGKVDVRTVHGIEVVNLGYTGGDDKILARMEREVRARKKRDNLVILSFHWGSEGVNTILEGQKKLGRAALAAGADLVIGTHPHVLQGIETRAGKHILYSIGNFVFGGNTNPADKDSIIYREVFERRNGEVVSVGSEIIPVRITTSPTGNDYRPVVLEGEDKERVLGRLKKYSDALPP
jgi:poly-gamma-glutamate synthesis protein (capsule biosynthesis protein)